MSETTEAMTTGEVRDSLEEGRRQVLAALDGLGERAATVEIGPAGRTAKDGLALLIHHAGDVAGGLGAELEPPDYVRGVGARLELDEWHRRAIEFWRPVPIGQVRAEFIRVVEALSAAVGRLSDAEIVAEDRIPWAGSFPTWRIIGEATWLQTWPAFVAAARG